MKIKAGKLTECFAFLPTLHLNWIETSKGMIYYLQFGWVFWYIEITIPAPAVVSKSQNAHIIGTAEHIKTALDVMDKKGGEK